MTTGAYSVVEVEDMGTAACECDSCEWKGTAAEVQEVQDCALTPGHPSPVGRCPNCDVLVYVGAPQRAAAPSVDPHMLEMLCQLDEYLREIRAENLDGSEPALGELLERSLSLRLSVTEER